MDDEQSDVAPVIANRARENAGDGWSDWVEVPAGHSGQQSVLITSFAATDVLAAGAKYAFSFECEYRGVSQNTSFTAISWVVYSDAGMTKATYSSRTLLGYDSYIVNGVDYQMFGDGVRPFWFNKKLPKTDEAGTVLVSIGGTASKDTLDALKGGSYIVARLIHNEAQSGSYRIRRAFAGIGSDSAAWTPESPIAGGGGSISAPVELTSWERLPWAAGTCHHERAARGVWSPFWWTCAESGSVAHLRDAFAENAELGCQAWLMFPEASYSGLRVRFLVTYEDANGGENALDAAAGTAPMAAGEWRRFAAKGVVPSGSKVTKIGMRLEDVSTGSAVRIAEGTRIALGGFSVHIGGFAPAVVVSGEAGA